MNVMIVDDSPKVREMIKQTLVEKIGGIETIHECSDGREAIEHYREVHPDWVLMDIQMEPVDGLTASRSIRISHPDARIVIVSAFDDPRYREAARSVGVHAYVLKESLWELRMILVENETTSE